MTEICGFLPGAFVQPQKSKTKRESSRLESEARKSCKNFDSHCLPFIFSLQAGIGSDYCLKQHGRNDSRDIRGALVASGGPLNQSHLAISREPKEGNSSIFSHVDIIICLLGKLFTNTRTEKRNQMCF